MSLRRHALLLAATMPAAACSGPPPAASDGNQVGSLGGAATAVLSNEASLNETQANDTAEVIADADYLGRWTGVEGMYLQVSQGDRPGRFRLEMQYDLDHKQTADARLDGSALVFERNGSRETLRPTDGAATGLKYLAGKKDCLTVADGEGYCRD